LRLRSAVGERKQWSAGGETAGTEPERNAAAEPQTEAARVWRIKKSKNGQPDVTWDGAESAKAGHGISGLLVRAERTRLFVTHSYCSPQLFDFIFQQSGDFR
jgi:hypothetical protein